MALINLIQTTIDERQRLASEVKALNIVIAEMSGDIDMTVKSATGRANVNDLPSSAKTALGNFLSGIAETKQQELDAYDAAAQQIQAIIEGL